MGLSLVCYFGSWWVIMTCFWLMVGHGESYQLQYPVNCSVRN